MAAPALVLASASPRRLDLLGQIGLVPDLVQAADIDESRRRDELPRELALRLAVAKAEAARRMLMAAPDDRLHGRGAVILAADTVVAVGIRALGKPADADEARRFLDLLSGRRHRVYGGVCVIDGAGKVRSRVVMTQVGFKRLSLAERETYLARGEWRGKAGGYAIQGLAAAFIPFIAGSYSNVVGLPLVETASLLAAAGIDVFTAAGDA